MTEEQTHGADKWEAQLRKGCLELAVLAVIARRPSYGLEILQALDTGNKLVLSEGTIYPILNRLRHEGLVNAEWVESEGGHPRKYYSLTRHGRERAGEMAAGWTEFAANISSLVEPLIRKRKARA